MKVFVTKPGSFIEIRRKVVPTMVIVFIGLFVIGVVIPAFARNEQINWIVFLFTVGLFAAVTGFATVNTLSRYRKGFESYRLLIDHESLTREQHNLPTIRIQFSDISRIVMSANRSIAIIGNSKLNAISVPAQIEGHEELQMLLENIRPIEKKLKKSFLERMFIPISLSSGLLIVANVISGNPWVDLACSVLLVIIMLGGFLVIQISRNIDYSTRRLSWIFIIPVVAYVVNIFMLLEEM